MLRYPLIFLCVLFYTNVFSQPELLPVFKNGKWAAMDTNLNLVTAFQYDDLFIVKNRFICTRQNGQYGLVNKNLEEVLPVEYEQVTDALADWLIVRKKGGWGVTNTNGETIVECNFDRVEIPIPGYAILYEDDGKCFYDLLNKTKSKAYDKIKVLKDSLFLLEKDSTRLLFNTASKEYSKEYIGIRKQTTGLFFCTSSANKKYVLTTRNGFNCFKTNQFLFTSIGQGHYAYAVNDSLRIIDSEGALKKNLRASWIKRLHNPYARRSMGSFFSEDYFIYQVDGSAGVLKPNFQVLISADYDEISLIDSLFYVYKEGKKGLIGFDGKVILPAKFISFMRAGRYWMVKDGTKWGVVLPGGQKVIDFKYDWLTPAFKNRFIARKNGETGILAQNGSVLLPFSKQKITTVSKCFVIEKDSVFGLVSIDGSVLFSPKYKKLRELSPDYFLFSEAKKAGVISTSGSIIIKPQFRNIYATEHEQIFFTESFKYGYASIADMKRDYDLDISIPKNDTRKRRYKLGLINVYGQEILESEYFDEQIYTDFQGNTIIVNRDSSVLVVTFDNNGRPEDKTSYKNYVFVKSSGPPITRNYWKQANLDRDYYYGLFSPRGRTILDYSFKDILKNFLNHPDLVRTTSPTGKYGIVNERTGKIMLPDVYRKIYTTDLKDANVIRCVKNSGRAKVIDSVANVLIKGIGYVDDFQHPYARVNKGGKLTYVNDFAHKLYLSKEKTVVPKRREGQEGRDIVCKKGKWGVIDKTGEWRIKPRYQFLQSYSNGVFIAQKDSKWGVVTPDDQIIIDFIYDELRYFSEKEEGDWAAIPFFKARISDKWGVIDKLGKNIVPMNFNGVEHLISKGKVYFKTLKDNKKILWGLVNKKGKLVLEPKYEYIDEFKNNFAKVKISRRKWKFLNMQMQEFPDEDFYEVKNFNEGLAAVKGRKGWGFIDKEGKMVIPCQYSDVGSFNEGLAKAKIYIPAKLLGLIKSKRVYALIDKNGQVIYNTKAKYCSNVSDGQVVVRKGRSYKLITIKGKKVLSGTYKEIRRCNNIGLYVVKNDKNQYALYDNSARLVIPYDQYNFYGNFSESLCFVKGNKGTGYINTNGKMQIKLDCKEGQEFSEGLAAVKLKKGWVYINMQGNVVIDKGYTHAWGFKNGVAKVRNKEYQVYYINKKGQKVDPLMGGYDNYRILSSESYKGIGDSQGNIVVYPVAKEINLFRGMYAPVGIRRQFGLYSSEGKLLTAPQYMLINTTTNGHIKLVNLEELKYLEAKQP
jgi:hypothetical protein